MHAAGLLHLDLKPKNTAIRNHRPVLLDFGAVLIQEEFGQRAHWARPEVITTTPGYVTEAEKVLATPQRDVYALGITLRDMIYGRSSLLELDDELYRDYCQQRYRDLPPQLQALSNIVDRMTEVDPEKRWALQQVADAFDRVQTGGDAQEKLLVAYSPFAAQLLAGRGTGAALLDAVVNDGNPVVADAFTPIAQPQQDVAEIAS